MSQEKIELDIFQQDIVRGTDLEFKQLLDIQKELEQFKIGDIYIREVFYKYAGSSEIEKTNHNVVAKYKVIHVSPLGIPWLRKIGSNGKLTGNICTIQHINDLINGMKRDHSPYGSEDKFVPDPAQLDAILLQQDFNPVEEAQIKAKLFNEINKHNKRVAINTRPNKPDVADFFKNSKPGDKFWTSPDVFFVIQSVVKGAGQWIITVLDVNQTTVTFNFSSFNFKRLYREQPRSFAKENKI
jgi:hypothetical protein